MYLSSIYLSICLSICKLENQAILRDFLSVLIWQHRKRGTPARIFEIDNSNTKLFCETSPIFQVDNVKNEASLSLRDFLQNGILSAELAASCQCVLWFFHSTCIKCCACHEKVIPGHTKCCTCHAKSFRKPEDLMLQNAPRRRKLAPWPPDIISDEHVSCTAPAMRNVSWRIRFKWPTPAIVFANPTKPSRFACF